MRALEALRAQIEFNRGAVPVLPPGAVTLADVDKVIADERIAAAAETVQDLKTRAEERGLSRIERARRFCDVARALRACGALEQALEWVEAARRMNRRVVPAKVIALLRDAVRFRDAIKGGSPPRIIDEEQVQALYKNLAVAHANESVLGMAVALRNARVETTAWTRAPRAINESLM